MKGNRIVEKSLKLWIAVCVVGLLMPVHAFSQSAEVVDFDLVGPIKFKSTIESIKARQAFMVVGERRVHLEFTVARKKYRASLKDRSGKNIAVRDFKKGERVFVQGALLHDGQVVAGLVQKIPNP